MQKYIFSLLLALTSVFALTSCFGCGSGSYDDGCPCDCEDCECYEPEEFPEEYEYDRP